eukprot:1180896-Rhodomonas_salina.1
MIDGPQRVLTGSQQTHRRASEPSVGCSGPRTRARPGADACVGRLCGQLRAEQLRRVARCIRRAAHAACESPQAPPLPTHARVLLLCPDEASVELEDRVPVRGGPRDGGNSALCCEDEDDADADKHDDDDDDTDNDDANGCAVGC